MPPKPFTPAQPRTLQYGGIAAPALNKPREYQRTLTEKVQAPVGMKITPYMTNLYNTTKGLGNEDRMAYLQATYDQALQRLQKYEKRIAMGLGLDEEAQRYYNNLKASTTDLRQYIDNHDQVQNQFVNAHTPYYDPQTRAVSYPWAIGNNGTSAIKPQDMGY
jgi:hypothetical protein